MKYLRSYLPVILIVVPVVVLVFIRSCVPGSFKPDAGKWAQASFKGSNLLYKDQVAAPGGKMLIVNLVNGNGVRISGSPDTLFVEAGRLLEKKNLKLIKEHKGPVLLVSDNSAISAKAWMILSQMGYRDLYVLMEKGSTEVLKYKFRPDSSAGI